jgi:hypothetical protein
MRSPEKGVMSATTQVKVLSPEIIYHRIGPRVSFLGSQYRYARNGECMPDVPGSESVADKRTVCIGTWENRSVPNRSCRGAGKVTKRYGVSVVGLTNIRGVAGVIPCGAKSSLEVVSGLTQRGGF